MLLRSQDEVNHLAELAQQLNLNRKRSLFVRMTQAVGVDMPMLTMEELTIFFGGTYQLRNAVNYYADHRDQNGDFVFEIANENLDVNFIQNNLNVERENAQLLKAKIDSRHCGSVAYYVYVLIDRSLNNVDAIVSHCCTCMSGLRENGACSHVATVIWYFSWARHQRSLPLPGSDLENIFNLGLEITNDDDDADDNLEVSTSQANADNEEHSHHVDFHDEL